VSVGHGGHIWCEKAEPTWEWFTSQVYGEIQRRGSAHSTLEVPSVAVWKTTQNFAAEKTARCVGVCEFKVREDWTLTKLTV
jgi:hypothetical protein